MVFQLDGARSLDAGENRVRGWTSLRSTPARKRNSILIHAPDDQLGGDPGNRRDQPPPSAEGGSRVQRRCARPSRHARFIALARSLSERAQRTILYGVVPVNSSSPICSEPPAPPDKPGEDVSRTAAIRFHRRAYRKRCASTCRSSCRRERLATAPIPPRQGR